MAPTVVYFVEGQEFPIGEGDSVLFLSVGGKKLPRPAKVSVSRDGATEIEMIEGPSSTYYHMPPENERLFSELEQEQNFITKIIHGFLVDSS